MVVAAGTLQTNDHTHLSPEAILSNMDTSIAACDAMSCNANSQSPGIKTQCYVDRISYNETCVTAFFTRPVQATPNLPIGEERRGRRATKLKGYLILDLSSIVVLLSMIKVNKINSAHGLLSFEAIT